MELAQKRIAVAFASSWFLRREAVYGNRDAFSPDGFALHWAQPRF